MVSAFAKVIQYEEDGWEEYLSTYLLFDVFKPVINYYKTTDRECYKDEDRNSLVKCAIRYIAHAYSLESDMINTQGEWEHQKRRVFDAVSSKPIREFLDDLVYLKSPEVVASITAWLEMQGEGNWQTYMMLKDLQLQMRQAAISELKKSSGELDYEAKFKCAGYNVSLQEMIKDAESNLIQNNPKLKAAIGEVTKLNKATRNTASMESFIPKDK